MSNFPEYDGTKPALIIKATLDLLHEPGSVFEVRIPKTKAGTISGYFDDTGIAATLIARENGKHQAIYATVNPVSRDLLSRAYNKFIFGSLLTTADKEISKRRWFLLDFDPVRATGISSSNAELELCHEKADMVVNWLSSIGWPEPLRADSGNGCHILFKVNEPNDESTRNDFECATKMLSSLFSDDKTKIDITVWNASRVWKIYGTVAAKGSSTKERPHRVAMLTKVPKEIQLLTRGQIENVARPLRDATSEEFRDDTGEYINDMSKWLTERGQVVTSGPRPLFGSEGQKWTIARCPFDETHVNPMVGLVNNRPIFRCLHDSCSTYRWKQFREKIDPHYKNPDVVFTLLSAWCNGEAILIDNELIQTACSTGKQLNGILAKLRKFCPRPRVTILKELLDKERMRFKKEVIGENNEKGNIVGLIARTQHMQEDGRVPLYWMSEFDNQIRVGAIGDINCPKYSDIDEINLLVKYHTEGDTWVKQFQVSQVIKFMASQYTTNPLKLQLDQLDWDGIKRLDTWLPIYLGTKDTEYTRAIGRKWLISAVARSMEPGCQADHMLILEGTQGIGKSQALRTLGGQFHIEYSGGITGGGTAHKDMVAVIIGKRIVELSELVSVKKSDREALKLILTKTVDEDRLSFERHPFKYPRTCVFAGTTNIIGQAYIADETGARRFWPTYVGECGPVRNDLLKQDKDQLWAEAVEAYHTGEDWFTVPIELTLEEQSDRQETIEDSDPWYKRIRSALSDSDSYANEIFLLVPQYFKGQITGKLVIRADDINKILGSILQIDIARQTSFDTLRVKKILRDIGFTRTRPIKIRGLGIHAYDLSEEDAGDTWSFYMAAYKSVKFPKQNEATKS